MGTRACMLPLKYSCRAIASPEPFACTHSKPLLLAPFLRMPQVVCTYHFDITPVRSEASSRLQVEHADASALATDYKLYLVQVCACG